MGLSRIAVGLGMLAVCLVNFAPLLRGQGTAAPSLVRVLRKTDPPPLSRQEWIVVSFQWPLAGYVEDGRSRPNMTIAEARALVAHVQQVPTR